MTRFWAKDRLSALKFIQTKVIRGKSYTKSKVSILIKNVNMQWDYQCVMSWDHMISHIIDLI